LERNEATWKSLAVHPPFISSAQPVAPSIPGADKRPPARSWHSLCISLSLCIGQGPPHRIIGNPSIFYEEDLAMLYWAFMFLVVALVAALFGFGGIAAEFAIIAKVLFVVFLVLFLVSLLTGAIRRPIS
jgi:uncharacterized membrane protein YtjA (UPF0391 family)